MPNSHFLGRKSYILKLNVVGYAHAVNMDTHDLSLEELKALNRQRSKARKEHFNYDALLALGKRKELVEERKQDKKEKSSSKRLFSQILKDINHAAPTGKRQDLRPRLAGSLELFGLEIVIIDIDNAENLQKEAHFLLDKSQRLQHLWQGVNADRLAKMLLPNGVTMKPRPIGLCAACDAEVPCHRIEWQYKDKLKCDRHKLGFLSKCTNCETPFPIPSDQPYINADEVLPVDRDCFKSINEHYGIEPATGDLARYVVSKPIEPFFENSHFGIMAFSSINYSPSAKACLKGYVALS